MRSAALIALCAAAVWAQAPEPDGAGVQAGSLPAIWTTGGPDCVQVPAWQIHEYAPDFYILRESGCTNYEKPFLYLLFGRERALLLDSGAGMTNVAQIVSELLAKHPPMPLVVAHSHAHGDHTSGDAQLRALPGVTVVGTAATAVRDFFGFRDWPNDRVTFDLGGRVLDVLAIPGHQDASIAIYDRQTGVLLTGDTIYPGRLYVANPAEFAASIRRLIEFTRGRIVTHLLGAHIEQSATPYVDFPRGTKYQPGEHRLELPRGILLEIDEALTAMGSELRRYALRDVTIWPNIRARAAVAYEPTRLAALWVIGRIENLILQRTAFLP